MLFLFFIRLLPTNTLVTWMKTKYHLSFSHGDHMYKFAVTGEKNKVSQQSGENRLANSLAKTGKLTS
jgi:hypothetical protein